MVLTTTPRCGGRGNRSTWNIPNFSPFVTHADHIVTRTDAHRWGRSSTKKPSACLPALWQHPGRVNGLATSCVDSDRDRADPDHARARERGPRERASRRVGAARSHLLHLGRRGSPQPRREELSEHSGPRLRSCGPTHGLVFFLPRRARRHESPGLSARSTSAWRAPILAVPDLLGYPLAAINNRVIFNSYFVAITLAALRFDWRNLRVHHPARVHTVPGLSAYVATHWDLRTS